MIRRLWWRMANTAVILGIGAECETIRGGVVMKIGCQIQATGSIKRRGGAVAPAALKGYR